MGGVCKTSCWEMVQGILISLCSLQSPTKPPSSSRMGMTLGMGSGVVWKTPAKEWVSTQPEESSLVRLTPFDLEFHFWGGGGGCSREVTATKSFNHMLARQRHHSGGPCGVAHSIVTANWVTSWVHTHPSAAHSSPPAVSQLGKLLWCSVPGKHGKTWDAILGLMNNETVTVERIPRQSTTTVPLETI